MATLPYVCDFFSKVRYKGVIRNINTCLRDEFLIRVQVYEYIYMYARIYVCMYRWYTINHP